MEHKKSQKDIKLYFEKMYYETYPLVYYIIGSLVRNENDTLDLVQDTYLSAFQNIDDIVVLDFINFKRWISTIATNKAKDFLKSKKPILFTDLERDVDEPFEIESDIRESPDVLAHQEELFEVVKKIMDALPENQRLCLFLFAFQEMSLNEISELTGLNINTVKSNIRYAREKVDKYFKEEEEKGFKVFSVSPFVLFVFGLKEKFRESQDLVIPSYINMTKTIKPSTVKVGLGLISRRVILGLSLCIVGSSGVIFSTRVLSSTENQTPSVVEFEEIIDIFEYLDVKSKGDAYTGEIVVSKLSSNNEKVDAFLDLIDIHVTQKEALIDGGYIILSLKLPQEKYEKSETFQIRTLSKRYLVDNIEILE